MRFPLHYFFPWRGGGSNENRSFFMLLKRRLEVDPPPPGHLKTLEKCHGGKGVVTKIGHFCMLLKCCLEVDPPLPPSSKKFEKIPWRGGGSNIKPTFFMLLKRRSELDPPPGIKIFGQYPFRSIVSKHKFLQKSQKFSKAARLRRTGPTSGGLRNPTLTLVEKIWLRHEKSPRIGFSHWLLIHEKSQNNQYITPKFFRSAFGAAIYPIYPYFCV